MTLTFNLEELYKKDVKYLDHEQLTKILREPVEKWQNFIILKDREKMMRSNFSTTSTEVFNFLEEKLGIEVDRMYNNYKRNQINTMIKKVAQTHKGKRTTLDYYQFRDLILLDEFNKFVLNNFGEINVPEEEMYKEIMFLQQNKFKETKLYEFQKQEDIKTIAYVLNLIPNFGEILKERYCLFIEAMEGEVFYGDLPLDVNELEFLDVISYRFRQTSNSIYKVDSEYDVNTTPNEQFIKWFLQDIDWWANEEILDSLLEKEID
ncbi:MAG: hypothetical protein ACK5LM_07830 [Lactovum sp.]